MRMPGMTGFQLQRELTERGIELPIIFITAHGEIPAATAAMRAGAVDFIPKPFSPQYLLERIHEAIALDRAKRRSAASQQHVKSHIASLTDREREVMELLSKGYSTKVIAARLGISGKTVDNHRAKVLEKMSVDNAAQLAILVAQLDAR
jgi:FixJ family two-component response regulator